MVNLYNALLWAAAPLAAAALALHPRHRLLLRRFHPPVPACKAKPVWVHACSVGEVNVAAPFLAAFQRRWPQVPLLLTVSTISGQAHARATLPDGCRTAWFPFDLRRTVRRFLREANPRALILIETELWPNVLLETAARGIPAAVINGRISERHYSRYRRARALFRPALKSLALAVMQNEVYASRIESLGAPSENIACAGNLKLDLADSRGALDTEELRARMGIPEGAPVVVFGSTRPGDEILAMGCWTKLRERFPELYLIVAPRHPKRIAEALNPFGEDKPLLRSEVLSGARSPAGERVIFVDTLGELGSFYALASVAVIGGSFDARIQGHNPIEPAALGVPVLFGPHMKNFEDTATLLIERDAAARCHDGAALAQTLDKLLSDSTRREQMGHNARQAIEDQHGAMEQTLDLLAKPLGLPA